MYLWVYEFQEGIEFTRVEHPVSISIEFGYYVIDVEMFLIDTMHHVLHHSIACGLD